VLGTEQLCTLSVRSRFQSPPPINLAAVCASIHSQLLGLTEVRSAGIFITTMEDGERGSSIGMWDERLFHRRAAATGNVLTPMPDNRVRGTSRRIDDDEVDCGT